MMSQSIAPSMVVILFPGGLWVTRCAIRSSDLSSLPGFRVPQRPRPDFSIFFQRIAREGQHVDVIAVAPVVIPLLALSRGGGRRRPLRRLVLPVLAAFRDRLASRRLSADLLHGVPGVADGDRFGPAAKDRVSLRAGATTAMDRTRDVTANTATDATRRFTWVPPCGRLDSARLQRSHPYYKTGCMGRMNLTGAPRIS